MPLELKDKSVFVFDWDGTLLDSMAIKTSNFSQVLSHYLAKRAKGVTEEQVAAGYRTHSGKPRRDIFALIAESYELALTKDDMDLMSDQLSELNKNGLAQAPLFPDALAFLRQVKQHTLYISSSVPQAELTELTKALPGDIYGSMKGIFGSSTGFSKGPEHIARILAETKTTPNHCVVFGDDLADVELSAASGVDCVLIDRDNKHTHFTGPRAASFEEIVSWLN